MTGLQRLSTLTPPLRQDLPEPRIPPEGVPERMPRHVEEDGRVRAARLPEVLERRVLAGDGVIHPALATHDPRVLIPAPITAVNETAPQPRGCEAVIGTAGFEPATP